MPRQDLWSEISLAAAATSSPANICSPQSCKVDKRPRTRTSAQADSFYLMFARSPRRTSCARRRDSRKHRPNVRVLEVKIKCKFTILPVFDVLLAAGRLLTRCNYYHATRHSRDQDGRSSFYTDHLIWGPASHFFYFAHEYTIDYMQILLNRHKIATQLIFYKFSFQKYLQHFYNFVFIYLLIILLRISSSHILRTRRWFLNQK